MNLEKICEIRDGIEQIVDAHSDDLRSLFDINSDICDKSSVIKKEYDELVAPNRQLHIGIVGRVKAGKSSMLNSLFFKGKDILPKAATPMTAALTKLKYSEQPTMKINFFTEEDIKQIKENAKQYKASYDRIVKEESTKIANNRTDLSESEIKEKANRSAKKTLKNNIILSGAMDQQNMLDSASQSVLSYIGKSIEKEITDVNKLGEELRDYVGSDGLYTAITKDVELGFNFEELKDITVVDTPGFDDPVLSRDAAARNSLKKCDVIFILSPAGTFCNEEDVKNIEKIEKGEGIQDIYVIASRIDSELGNEHKDESDGSLEQELKLISEDISDSLELLIKSLDPGKIKEKLQSDLDEGLIYTSGACQSMYEMWDNRDEWSNDLQDVWERLQEDYPDYFGSEDESAKEVLKVIGNVDKIREKISEVRSKKDEILYGREEKFLTAKRNAVSLLVSNLVNDFISKKKDFENLDIGKIQDEKKKQEENFSGLQADFSEALDTLFEDYYLDTRELCSTIIKDFYDGAVTDSNDAKGTGTEMKTVTRKVPYKVTVKSKGLGNLFRRFIGSGGYEDITKYNIHEESVQETYNNLNASEVRNAITEFATNLKDALNFHVDKQRNHLRGEIKSSILNVWAKYEINEYCCSSDRNTQARAILQSIPFADFNIEWELPENLQCSGKIRDKQADEFLDKAKDELRRIKADYQESVNDFLTTIRNVLHADEVTTNILKKMKDNLDDLTKKLENQKATLDNYSRIENELTSFSSQIN